MQIWDQNTYIQIKITKKDFEKLNEEEYVINFGKEFIAECYLKAKQNKHLLFEGGKE